jgi:predicted secreted protein
MAQTTGLINGSNLRIMLDEDGGTPVMVDNVTDCSISVSTEMKDTSVKEDGGYKAVMPGRVAVTVSFTAYFEEADASSGYTDIIGWQLAGTLLNAKFTQMIGTATTENTGDHAFTFDAYVTSCDLSGGVEDQATYSVTLETVGTVTYAAIS